MNAATRRDERIAWLHSAYVIPAHHDPDKFPEMPTLHPKERNDKAVETQRDADAIAARQIMKAWANRSPNG